METQELHALGGNTILNVITTIVVSTGYGTMVLMMFIAMHYLSKKQWTIPVIALTACCIVMFVLFTMFYTYFLAVVLLIVAANTDESPQQVASYVRTEQDLAYIAPYTPALPFFVGDVIVVWRAWVLLPTGRFYKILLSVLMLANSGIIIADIVFDYMEISSEVAGFSNIMDWIMCIGSLLINLFATLLIGWKLWAHRRSVNLLPARSSGHQIQKIMIIFIESGALMGIAQVMNLAFITAGTYNLNPTWGFLYAFHFFITLAPVATAWYPLAVIIMVNTGNSPVYATVHFTESSVLEDPQSIREHNDDGIL
ncbi:hypothetical protein D9757_013153 [Collybiopsis confluens]|uniref:Uncharacterized protein n=1 Tax=Collybiopsis confluens TaxID=2823264 RepID=A0A8H5D8W7_9AGAR|nr:hypothetical protein D9757_013153 [Collybiopsis confluens]